MMRAEAHPEALIAYPQPQRDPTGSPIPLAKLAVACYFASRASSSHENAWGVGGEFGSGEVSSLPKAHVLSVTLSSSLHCANPKA